MQSLSPAKTLNKADVWKIARGAIIIAAGAFAVELLSQAKEILDGHMIGQFEFLRPLLISGLASAIEAVRRYFKAFP